ncbi:MAG: D-2-hydroxyacid dehydrogenase family protein [Rhizomicrobium sp.]
MKIAILDDYARAALRLADWSEAAAQAEIVAFDRHLTPEEMPDALASFEVICTVRERSTIPAGTLSRLPKLRLITVTDSRVRSVDFAAAAARGVVVSEARPPGETPPPSHAAAEFTWGLLLALVRHIPAEAASLRAGHWQSSLGLSLAGRTLGLVGFGRIGRRMARYAAAFGMDVLAWSQNLSAADAEAGGARLVEKRELFGASDIVSVHYLLSARSRGIVGRSDIAAMKPSAYLINTSRGPLVDEDALVAALREKAIAGAALDVFNQEPLPKDHPLLALDNVVLTPHLGFVTEDAMRRFYQGMAFAVAAYLRGEPVNLLPAT